MSRCVYDETWQIVLSDIQQENPQYGRKSVPFFKTLKFVDDFIKSIPTDECILDMGCGLNLFKIHYPEWNIYGIDKTLEADQWGYLEEVDLNSLDYKHAMAINSIHFEEKDKILDRINKIYNGLPLGGYFMFTLNAIVINMNPGLAFDFFCNYNWESIDNVVYKSVRTPEDKENMKTKVENMFANDLKSVINVIDNDWLYGTIRIILQKTRR